jgi:transposase
MSYSIDLRKRVLAHVSEGGSKAEASRLFGVGRPTIYRWLSLSDLTPGPAKTRKRKLDKAQLALHVRSHPEALLRERAAAFGVTPSGMWRALRKMRISKKND